MKLPWLSMCLTNFHQTENVSDILYLGSTLSIQGDFCSVISVGNWKIEVSFVAHIFKAPIISSNSHSVFSQIFYKLEAKLNIELFFNSFPNWFVTYFNHIIFYVGTVKRRLHYIIKTS